MALDLDRGNRLEVPWLSGKVAELGRQFGIADADAQHDACDAEAVCDGVEGVTQRTSTITASSIGSASQAE